VTEPRRPALEPLQTDEVRVVAVGTALFALGLVLTLVLHDQLDDHGRGDWVWVMVCGVLLGLVGIRTVRRRREALRREASEDPSDGGTDPNLP
jgi:hypothetical protein